MIDLMYFLIIIVTIMSAFGVASQAILKERNESYYKIIYGIFETAYWPIYGELGMLKTLEEKFECKNSSDKCIDFPSYVTVYLLLVVYMIIASVLLLNLLIALFS
jgi:transient receptor potential cation channel subfamily M protein 4